MKWYLWLIVGLAVSIAGYFFYTDYQAQLLAAGQAPAPTPTPTPAPAPTPGTPVVDDKATAFDWISLMLGTGASIFSTVQGSQQDSIQIQGAPPANSGDYR